MILLEDAQCRHALSLDVLRAHPNRTVRSFNLLALHELVLTALQYSQPILP